MKQRVAALNAFLHDIYHDRHITKDGVVPADLVYGNANYRPEMERVPVRFGTYVHICGTDIVRDQEAILGAEIVQQRIDVIGDVGGVVAFDRWRRVADARRVERHDMKLRGKPRHHLAPGMQRLRPSRHQQHQRPAAAFDDLQFGAVRDHAPPFENPVEGRAVVVAHA